MSASVEILVIVLLVLLNGFFAMAEMAIVSAKKARLQPLAEAGDRRAQVALALASEPSRFLSGVQVGITLIGIFAGAYGGAGIAARLAPTLRELPLVAPIADGLALALVVMAITYLSLIVGELVPKQLALRNPERLAMLAARPLLVLTRVANPIVWLMDRSSRVLLRLFGTPDTAREAVSEDEVKAMIAEGVESGSIHHSERRMMEGVLRLADRPVRGLMTPRREVVWLEQGEDLATVQAKVRESGHSRFPVCHETLDDVVGVVQARDLVGAGRRPSFALRDHVRDAVVIPDSMSGLQALHVLKSAAVPMALVVDEYGTFEGIITDTDVLEAIVGSLQQAGADDSPAVVERPDGGWLIDGVVSTDELRELLRLKELPEGDYHTVAGLMLYLLRRVPAAGDTVDLAGYRFEVVDMDARRVDKVMVTACAPSEGGPH